MPVLGIVPVLGILLALPATPAGAVTEIESTYGSLSPWYSAELNGQSVTGAAQYRGGMSNLLNPAGLALATGVRADLGINADHHEEERFVPLFDSFDNVVDDVSIASNQNTWWGAGYALAAQLDPGPLPVVVGLSLVDRYPFAYRFEEELRDPDPFASPRDRILEEREYEVSGTVRQLSLGLAAAPSSVVSLGASIHYAFGDHTARWNVRDNDPSGGDGSYNTEAAWDLNGVNATFGVQVRAGERVRLGVAYETSLNVDGDHRFETFAAGDSAATVVESAQSMTYPAYWRFGAAFYPRSDPRTVFTADLVYSDWTKLEDSRWSADARPSLNKVYDVRIGLQHTFYNDFDLRFGFRRYENYNQTSGGNSIFSLGAGFPVLQGELSVSLELNKQQVDSPHIFGYPADFVSEEEARVDDLRTRLGLGWSRVF
jgi:hypothetical protein